MNRRILVAGFLAAMPGVLCAQEYKLVNCRTLEAAGNFVGSDEVLNGDIVCRKVQAAAALATTAEATKPMPGAVISGSESMNVVEAAKASDKKAGPAKDGNTEKSPAAANPAPAPVPTQNAEPLPAESKTPTPEETAPAAAPLAPATPVTPPQVALPVTQSPKQPIADGEPPSAASATAPVSAAAPDSAAANLSTPSAPAAAPAQIHRDAPVAEGTPSAPPEKDYGFSDANAVESPVAARAESIPTNRSADHNTVRNVQLGAFAKPAATPAEADSNPLPGDADGFQEGQRAGCSKNVTLGGLRDDKLVLGTPAWVQKWIEKNQKRLAKICFSATPMRGAQNYLIVFYTLAGSGQGNNRNTTLPLPDVSARGGVGGFTTQYGSTWHYVVDRKVGTTVLTKDAADEPQVEQPLWYAAAYSEDGTAVAEHWPERGKNGAKNEKAEHVSEELLAVMVEDLRKL